MNKKVCIISVALAVSIILIPIFTTAQQGAELRGGANQKSSPAKGKEQQNKRHRETAKPESPQPKPAQIPVTIEAPVTVIHQPSAQEQAEEARKQAKGIWNKFVDDVLFNPLQWPNTGLLILAGLAAWFTYGAYCATHRQAVAAEETLKLSTRPRLCLDGVRAVDLTAGKRPIFFVRIINSGPVAAEQVAIKITVKGDPPYCDAEYSGGDNRITIPANSARDYFIKVTSDLTPAHIQAFNSPDAQSGQLRVTGYFEHEGKREDYCYKYNPSEEPRPEGFAQFIPCDFDTSRTQSVKLTGRVVGTFGISGSLTVKY